MKRLLLVAALFTLGGCAMMSDEDRDFYGRGWVNPKELDQPYPHHAGTPRDSTATTASAPTSTTGTDQLSTTGDPAHDSAWDVPGGPPR